ncbi:MAG: hypothetical protein K0B37_05325 [Bacteroidales bacterium]|nr:hypothetical protein [Bacteroidales bacterium]
MQVFLLALALVALAIGGIAIKMFFIPGETFKKTCGSTFDPETGKPKPCACASGQPEDCHNSEESTSSKLIINLKKN